MGDRGLRNLVQTFVCLAACVAVVCPARAAYPTPQSAGFHHCALIYGKASRTAEDFAPYVAYDKEPAWLFDSYLFLILTTGRGVRTEDGPTQKVDWEYHLDQWFAPGRDLAALDDAIETASKRLGQPSAKRTVMLSIPFVNPAVKDFGEIGGKPVDLSKASGREAAVRWYVEEGIRRFQAGRYRHLRLWGFYMVRETIRPEDMPAAQMITSVVHEKGYRVLWIPWHGATGYAQWKRAGVDVAIYQPNYAFNVWQYGGDAGRNRLAVTADTAKANGMGVEIESNAIDSRPSDQRVFAQYLADGAPGRCGYQAGATAYYLDTSNVEHTSRSSDPSARKAYDNLARYVRNLPVADPDEPIAWRWTAVKGARVAEARFAKPRAAAAVEAFLDEPIAPGWWGVVDVAVLRPGAREWTAEGWVIRPGGTRRDGRHQWVYVPVGGTVTGVRVTFRPMRNSAAPKVTSLAIDPNDVTGVNRHAALGRPYTIAPPPAARFADSGRKLTDGVTAGGCYGGAAVGWLGAGRDVAVCFDLGRAMPVSQVRVYAQGGGIDGVEWPDRALALFALNQRPPVTMMGRGALPDGFTTVPGGAVVVDRRRTPADMDGHVDFRPAKAVKARYVTLMMRSNGWLMLSEARIIVDGRNVAPKAAYTLLPPPTGGLGHEASYVDDGIRLTDGEVVREFSPAKLSGWHDDAPRTVTLDMGGPQPVRGVTVWSLCGGGSGIYAPKEIAVESSADGKTWQPLGVVLPQEEENGNDVRALPCAVTAKSAVVARWVRVRVTRSHDWAMLSEVAVR